jgi:hypothetical protein
MTHQCLAKLLSAVSMFVAAAGVAQQVPSPPVTSAPFENLIQALSGRWHLNVRFEPTASNPKPIDGEGEETWRAGPGNYTFIEEEKIPMPKDPAYLLGILWMDTRTQSMHGMECNSMLPYTCDLKGALNDITITWDGKKLQIDEIETHDGKKTVWREAWTEIRPTSFLQTGDVTQSDGSTSRFMTVEGTRIGQ